MSGETADNPQREQVSLGTGNASRQAEDEAVEESTPPAGPERSPVPEKQVHRWKDDGGAVIFD